MEKLADEKKMFYIIGDINIDINKTNQNSPQAGRYTQVMINNGQRRAKRNFRNLRNCGSCVAL